MTELEKWIQPPTETALKIDNLPASTPYESITEMEMKIRNLREEHLKNYGWNFRYEKTALARKTITAPLRIALEKEDFQGKIGIDFGCGQAKDADFLNQHGSTCFDYDFFFKPLKRSKITPNNPKKSVDYVLLFYVLNILPPQERQIIAQTVTKCLDPKSGKIIIALREDEYSIQDSWQKWEDGFITTNKTFQIIPSKNKENEKKIRLLFPEYKIERIGRGTFQLCK